MDALVGVPWSGLGWGGLIFLAVLLIIRGDLVPRSTHERIVGMHQDNVTRERARADQAVADLHSFIREYGTNADKVLSALPVVTDEGIDHATG